MPRPTDEEFDPTALDRGTVVWSIDPFKLTREDDRDDESSNEATNTNDSPPGRPVAIVNTDEHPFAGEQYLALPLTTKTWYTDHLVRLSADGWHEGGTDSQSYLVPWSVLSPQPNDTEFWIGQLTSSVLNEAIQVLLPYLHSNPEQLAE